MSFNAKALVRQNQVPIAQADGSAGTTFCTKWFYATVDTFATVATAGYFNGARASLKVGDQIELASTATNKGGLYQVTAVPTTGNVTVTPAVLA